MNHRADIFHCRLYRHMCTKLYTRQLVENRNMHNRVGEGWGCPEEPRLLNANEPSLGEE